MKNKLQTHQTHQRKVKSASFSNPCYGKYVELPSSHCLLDCHCKSSQGFWPHSWALDLTEFQSKKTKGRNFGAWPGQQKQIDNPSWDPKDPSWIHVKRWKMTFCSSLKGLSAGRDRTFPVCRPEHSCFLENSRKFRRQVPNFDGKERHFLIIWLKNLEFLTEEKDQTTICRHAPKALNFQVQVAEAAVWSMESSEACIWSIEASSHPDAEQFQPGACYRKEVEVEVMESTREESRSLQVWHGLIHHFLGEQPPIMGHPWYNSIDQHRKTAWGLTFYCFKTLHTKSKLCLFQYA